MAITVYKNKMTTHNRPIFFISYPRSASNLFIRLLGLDQQPAVIEPSEMGGYHFLNPYFHLHKSGVLTKPLVDCSEDDKRKGHELLREALEDIDACVQAAESQGKIFFNKEHIHMLVDPYIRSKTIHGEESVRGQSRWRITTSAEHQEKATANSRENKNNTFLPDAYLRKWQATFLIRHPALAIPSYYRAHLDVHRDLSIHDLLQLVKLGVNLRQTRLLFDWFNSDNKTMPPLLLDAHDVIHQPGIVLGRYCELVGLDPAKLQFHWTPTDKPETHASKARFFKTIRESTGVMLEKAPASVVIEQEWQQWREEFGQEVAQALFELVQEAMPDYEYLKEKRIKI